MEYRDSQSAQARSWNLFRKLSAEPAGGRRHYDWGLRAIKSVLVVAGSLLRACEGQEESDVLFRALRDFNLPKILAQDLVIFNGLLRDLFPGVDPPRNRDFGFEQVQGLPFNRNGTRLELMHSSCVLL
jgi:Hydrolytic ATP binding site of dynein motor region